MSASGNDTVSATSKGNRRRLKLSRRKPRGSTSSASVKTEVCTNTIKSHVRVDSDQSSSSHVEQFQPQHQSIKPLIDGIGTHVHEGGNWQVECEYGWKVYPAIISAALDDAYQRHIHGVAVEINGLSYRIEFNYQSVAGFHTQVNCDNATTRCVVQSGTSSSGTSSSDPVIVMNAATARVVTFLEMATDSSPATNPKLKRTKLEKNLLQSPPTPRSSSGMKLGIPNSDPSRSSKRRKQDLTPKKKGMSLIANAFRRQREISGATSPSATSCATSEPMNTSDCKLRCIINGLQEHMPTTMKQIRCFIMYVYIYHAMNGISQ